MNQKEIHSQLAALDLNPSKALGQNFLHDRNLAQWIVDAAKISTGDSVVEIGPGLGALTGILVETGGNLLAIERDPRLADFIRQNHGEKIRDVFCGDAARYDVRKLFPFGPLRVIGNLPYSAAAPILFNFTNVCSPANHLIIMVQQEMAERMYARPGSSDYGVLSVLLQRRWDVQRLKKVGHKVFYPQPQIDSTIVRMEALAGDTLIPCEDRAFIKIVKSGFSQRRKQLGKLLKDWTTDWSETARQVGIRADTRAENLDLPEWVMLTNVLTGQHGAKAQDPTGEQFDVVDENDQVIDRKSREWVHVNNLRHRAVHIVVENHAGELFLQKRSRLKDKFPGRWDSSAAGHVDSGESYEGAAAREIREELGVDIPLCHAGQITACGNTGWEFVHVFSGQCDGPFRLPPSEIEFGGFFPLDLVREWIAARPGDFAPGFLECFKVRYQN